MATMAELTGQLAIDFTMQNPESDRTELSVKLAVELDPSMVRGEIGKLESQPMTGEIVPPLGLREQMEKTIRGIAVKLQDLLGYKLYVIVGLAALGLAAIIALLIVFLVMRKIWRKITGK